MAQMIAVLRGGRIAEIIARRAGKKILRDCERLVDVSGRPDLKVGDTWPFAPAPEAPPERQQE